MYLRSSNLWSKFLLAEGIEDIGLPTQILNHIKGLAEIIPKGTPSSASDYQATWELIQKELIKNNVYRDVAKEVDDADEREDSPQLELPLQEHKLILNRWRKIITP